MGDTSSYDFWERLQFSLQRAGHHRGYINNGCAILPCPSPTFYTLASNCELTLLLFNGFYSWIINHFVTSYIPLQITSPTLQRWIWGGGHSVGGESQRRIYLPPRFMNNSGITCRHWVTTKHCVTRSITLQSAQILSGALCFAPWNLICEGTFILRVKHRWRRQKTIVVILVWAVYTRTHPTARHMGSYVALTQTSMTQKWKRWQKGWNKQQHSVLNSGQ